MFARLRSTQAGLILVLAFLTVPAAHAQTWYEAYHRAEEALAAEQWTEAVRLLNASVDQKPDSGANVRTYGMRFVRYFPYLKLGIAYYHLGQAEAAIQAFETELSQGAINQSAQDLQLLTSFRERIDSERLAAEQERDRRASSVFTQSMAQALRFETEGQLDEALGALGRALAVVPDDGAAQQAQSRVLAALALEQRQEEAQNRRNELVAEGRTLFASGDYAAAAARFSEADRLSSDAEVEALLAQAQRALRARLDEGARSTEANDRQALVSSTLARARELADAGQPELSLAELQSVLALDPRNEAALSLQRRLSLEQAAAAQTERDDTSIRDLLAQANRLASQGDEEGVLRTVNRVLILEPTHEAALNLLARAYSRLSDRLLTSDEAPPVILLDAAITGVGAAEVALVHSPAMSLTGRAYDATPVEVLVLEAGQPVGTVDVERQQFNDVWISNFHFEHRLPTGTSDLEIVAADENGNRSTLAYRVEYSPPFLRSIWLPITLASVLALVVATFFAVRTKRRRRRLRVRFNPYVAGAPILEQSRFFGRQQLLEYVLRRIGNNSVMLYGERRIGKTSFQHRLKRCLTNLDDPEHEFFPVFVDLQGIPEERFFATLASEVFHELGPRLGGLEPGAALADESYGYREFVRDVQRVLAALETRASRRVKLVLLIDEVDELNHYDPRINQRLRSLFMRALGDRLVAVVSGVAIKKQWEREGSPWYNFFQEIEVRPLDPEEARSLIEKPVHGTFSFENGASEEIIRRTHSKPYLIQRVCTALIDRMHEEHRLVITDDDVQAACAAEGL